MKKAIDTAKFIKAIYYIWLSKINSLLENRHLQLQTPLPSLDAFTSRSICFVREVRGACSEHSTFG